MLSLRADEASRRAAADAPLNMGRAAVEAMSPQQMTTLILEIAVSGTLSSDELDELSNLIGRVAHNAARSAREE